MVMLSLYIGTLTFSSVGLVLLVGLKRFEMNTGRVVGSRLRRATSKLFHVLSLWVEHILPTLVRMYSKIVARAFLRSIYKMIALAVVRVEHTLERTLQSLRHSTDIRRGYGEASMFLREVSQHKRKLTRSKNTPVRLNKE